MANIENKIDTYNLYIDNNNNLNKYPIHWMEIKQRDVETNDSLLIIPYSPLINDIKNFEDAIYKQKATFPNGPQDKVLQSINNFYDSSDLIFSIKFINKISEMDEKTSVKFNIYYNLEKENFTYNHLYFLNFLTHFGSIESVDANKMTITIDKQHILDKTIRNIFKSNMNNNNKYNDNNNEAFSNDNDNIILQSICTSV